MLDVATLRELFRNLPAFRALYEARGFDVVHSPNGETYTLWDVEYLYEQVNRLARRQRQAIQLFLVEDMREREAAEEMGLSPTNPIGMYVTDGLTRIIDWYEHGELERFQPTFIKLRELKIAPAPARGGRKKVPAKPAMKVKKKSKKKKK